MLSFGTEHAADELLISNFKAPLKWSLHIDVTERSSSALVF